MIIHEVCKRICEDCHDRIDTLGKGCVFLDIDNEYCDEIFEINNLVNNLISKSRQKNDTIRLF